MSKPALQQFSKELRGKIQTSWQIEMDEEMMTMFLKLKKNLGKFGSNLSNKEAMRRMLKMMVNGNTQNEKKKKRIGTRGHEGCVPAQPQAKISKKIPGDFPEKPTKITRYIPIAQKRLTLSETNGKCAHENCHQPAQILHHQARFSQTKSHDSLLPLCKTHHEFAHNGITEPTTEADEFYRKYRQNALR